MRRPRRKCPHGGEANCAECRRAYQREYVRRKRAQRLVEEARALKTCPKRHGPGRCGGILETVIDRITGATRLFCPLCDRQARGICRDCPRPVAGRVGYALRCTEHQEAARRAQVRASEQRHREARREKDRERYFRPDVHQRRLEYKRAWRKANREKVKAQKRRAALRQPKRVYEYAARYRKRYREHYAEAQRQRYHEETPRPQPKCTKCGAEIPYEPPGRPYTTCDNCCWPHQLQKREAKRARLAAEQAAREAELEAQFIKLGRLPKPKPIRRPRQRARTNERGERLCVGDTCTTVVRGREKKCEACKAAERELAAVLLAARRGRGRRTDLERGREEHAA